MSCARHCALALDTQPRPQEILTVEKDCFQGDSEGGRLNPVPWGTRAGAPSTRGGFVVGTHRASVGIVAKDESKEC